MAIGCLKIIFFSLVMLVTILDFKIHASIEGLQELDKSNFSPKPTGTIKTIEVPEDGDIIDCVDIYKQPTLNNPLIKDKNIQMKPSSNLFHGLNKTNKPLRKLIPNWHKYGECPKGTVPIRRARIYNDTIRYNDQAPREYAVWKANPSTYYGARAFFNVWNPRVSGLEFSLSQLWIVSSNLSHGDLNTLEVGWMVYPNRCGDSESRLFTFWTNDGYKSKRCYDYACNGFMQTNNKYALGEILETSIYNNQDEQYEIFISIRRDEASGHWWLTFIDTEIGYFPRDIFTSLNSGASNIDFGGEIVNTMQGNRHTETQMGSGHFPSDGLLGKSTYIRNMEVLDRDYQWVDANYGGELVTKPNCYNFKRGRRFNFKQHFYFGGPGYSPLCE